MRPRTLAILLGLSLVLNVFVVGAFAGVFFGRVVAAPPPGAQRPNALMSAAGRLNPNDRDAFRALMQDVVQRDGPTQLDAREARRQAATLMRAPSFDRVAAGAALDRARADDLQVRRDVENTMLDFAAKLDANGRMVLSEGLFRGPGWLARRAGPPPPAPPAPAPKGP